MPHPTSPQPNFEFTGTCKGEFPGTQTSFHLQLSISLSEGFLWCLRMCSSHTLIDHPRGNLPSAKQDKSQWINAPISPSLGGTVLSMFYKIPHRSPAGSSSFSPA